MKERDNFLVLFVVLLICALFLAYPCFADNPQSAASKARENEEESFKRFEISYTSSWLSGRTSEEMYFISDLDLWFEPTPPSLCLLGWDHAF